MFLTEGEDSLRSLYIALNTIETALIDDQKQSLLRAADMVTMELVVYHKLRIYCRFHELLALLLRLFCGTIALENLVSCCGGRSEKAIHCNH